MNSKNKRILALMPRLFRNAALLTASISALMLAGCVGPDEQRSDVAATADSALSNADLGTADYGIAWHEGNVASAFERATADNKPVYLYWGADWCPPCNQIKATIFTRPEFIERSRLFVPVNLNGDESGAQKLGEEFGVLGYPTVIVFTPGGEEITRIPGGLDIERYAAVMDIALEASRPVADAFAAVETGSATPADFRLLAYYAWDQDNERLVRQSELSGALQKITDACPPEMPLERSRLFMQYLVSLATPAEDGNADPVLSQDEQSSARAAAKDILTDPQLVATNLSSVIYRAGAIYPVLASPSAAANDELFELWIAALDGIQNAGTTSVADSIGALYGKATLVKAHHPDAPLPESLLAEITGVITRADASTQDPYVRMAFVNAAWNTLTEAGLDEFAYELTSREVEISKFPEYIMLDLAALARRAGQTDEALAWLEKAWQKARGPATRFQWGTSYVIGLLEMAPDNRERIENVTVALFRELEAESDAFFLRTTARMSRLASRFEEWNSNTERRGSIDRIRDQVGLVCAKLAEGDVSRNNCEEFLTT
jgi:thioredoxin-like negative regulator of GroEL